MQTTRHTSARTVLTAALASAALLLFAAAPAAAAGPAPCDGSLTAYQIDILNADDHVLLHADLNSDGTVCVRINAADYALVVDNGGSDSLVEVGVPEGLVAIDIGDSATFGDISLVDGNNNQVATLFSTNNRGGQYFSHNNALRNVNLKGITFDDVVSIGL